MNKREQRKLAKELENAETLGELKAICCDYGLSGFLDSYLTYEETWEYIKNNCDELTRVYYCTQEIKRWNQDYYYLNVYGNLENAEDLEKLKDRVWDRAIEIN